MMNQPHNPTNLQKIIPHLIDVTQQCAIAAFKMAGNGEPKTIDETCAEIGEKLLDLVPSKLHIQMSEGKKDGVKHIEQSKIFGKEKKVFVFDDEGRLEGEYDVAIDVVDGTKQCSIYGRESISAISVCHHKKMWKNYDFYVKKLAYSPYLKQRCCLSLYDSPEMLVKLSRGVLDRQPVITVLDRPRHEVLISQLKYYGAVVRLVQDCDIGYAIQTCLDDGELHDIYVSSGGTSEAVISAPAIRHLGGHFEIQLLKEGLPDGSPISMNKLVEGESAFICSGILDGVLVKGCKLRENKIKVSSLVITEDNIMRIEKEFKQ